MTTNRIPQMFRQVLSTACVFTLVGTGALLMGQQPPPPAPPAAQAPPPAQFAQLLSPDQLDDLVAPIALYPDNLLGQLLVASTYPLEVVEAAQWLQQNRNLRGTQLVDAARQQNWDPSIQALVVFPDVLNRLNSDIRWTTDLGNAFLAQQNDVMNSVQRMRARARAAGKLNSNSQETVTTQPGQAGPPAVVIAPTDPQVVYVPVYDPAYIWGPPAWGYYPPLYYPPFGFGFGFGPGIYIGSFFGGLGWGGWGWGPNWFGGGIYLNAGFFNHYGFGGYGAGFRGGVWAHNPVHRMGVNYANRGLAARYGAASTAARTAQSGFARGGASGAQAGGWHRFGEPGSSGSVVAPRSGASAQSSARTEGGWSRFGGATAQSSARTPANGGSSAYRSTPSYSGGAPAGRAAPSYRSAPSSGGGGVRSAPSSGGGGSRGGGGGGSRGGGHGGGHR